ncbi:MAG: peptide chain release factor N(5)-glutamine methyltransferase [Pseudomonadota bacterium]|nr:peptide chain release factor N(5)-glutamine methyltransferase [Pseudomonadota bacterium]
MADAARAGDLLDAAARRLTAAGIPTARLDARVLLGAALDADPSSLLPGSLRAVAPEAVAAFEVMLARRLDREPVARITGRREFYGRTFRVTPDVLDPRADSEAAVDLALTLLPADRPARLLDLGTGSGCLLLTLLAERPLATGTGVDRSRKALATAMANAADLGLAERAAFIAGDWFDAVAGVFDLVISNPPYIPAGEIATLEPEVRRFDPHLALDGGPDGLDCYRAILRGLPGHLSADGVVVLEHGAGQSAALADLAADAGMVVRERVRDLGGHLRALALAWAGGKKMLGMSKSKS